MGSSGSHGRGAPGRLLPGLVMAISLGSASLGALLAASVLGRAAENPGPSTPADEQPVTRPAPAGEAFPSLGRAPERPTPTMSQEERRRLTDSLIGDRSNARYTNEKLRGGLEPEAAAPRSLPPLSEEEQKKVAEQRQKQREAARLDLQSQEPAAMANSSGLPQPLPADEEARSYSARTIPNGAGRMASRVPGPVIAREYQQPNNDQISPDAGQAEAPGLDKSGQKVRPLRMPSSVASLPIPGGGGSAPVTAVAAIPRPTVISSLDNPVAARPRGPAAIPQAPLLAGLVPTPGVGAVPVYQVPQTALGPLVVPAAPSAPGMVVGSTYAAGLAASRQVRLASATVPQFQSSMVPALPATMTIPLTPAMQAALSGNGSATGLPVIPTIPADLQQRAAGAIPDAAAPAGAPAPRAPSRYDVAIGAGGAAATGNTAIDFAAGSSKLDGAGREAVRSLATQLAATAGQVVVIGYARAKGDAGDPVNAFGVSIDRANKVAAELMAAGVSPRQVRVEAVVADAARSGAAGRQAVIVVQ